MQTLIENNKGQICGIFTDGDLRRALNKNLDINSQKIKEIMTTSYQFINESSSIKECISIMEKNKIYSLVVKNNKNSVSGVLRMHDLLEAKII